MTEAQFEKREIVGLRTNGTSHLAELAFHAASTPTEFSLEFDAFHREQRIPRGGATSYSILLLRGGHCGCIPKAGNSSRGSRRRSPPRR
jgi:hypothetical protein